MSPTQIKTDATISVDEALEQIHTGAKCISVDGPFGRAFIRRTIDEGYVVNAFLPVIDERRNLSNVDEDSVVQVIKGADTARVVSIVKSPWSSDQEDD